MGSVSQVHYRHPRCCVQGLEAQFIRNQYSLNPISEFNAVALETLSSYTEIFHCALRLSYFNFRLKDYSFFQFSQTGDAFA
jgi:hypothetical protein